MVKKWLFLLMISTCQEKTNSEVSHLWSYSDNGSIMKVGLIDNLEISLNPLQIFNSQQQWVPQVVVELKSQRELKESLT